MSALPLHEFQCKSHLLGVFYVVDIEHGENIAEGHNGGGDVVVDNFPINSNLEYLVTLNTDNKKTKNKYYSNNLKNNNLYASNLSTQVMLTSKKYNSEHHLQK